MAAGGDAGRPVAGGEGELAEVFAELARVLAVDVAPIIEASGCTGRMLAHVEAAVAAADQTG